ncbi:hypothetical protein [Acidiphilium sp. JA12-A1]|uniref:hypothetical protein n=1 Tax=Acidiphilium sp. JA12-A1 TaxID=1464546 RepID=UPI000461487D|nr:hypothetical protein [Acidiphilium sp. JA12-A1]KDM66483.1 hypothetical protein ACIDI_61c00030 [Acidiphilium sp. JA12-A1]
MQFKPRNLRAIADMVIGDVPHFQRRSSYYITTFMQECDLDDAHDGTTRSIWTAGVLEKLLAEASPAANTLPNRFVNLLRVLMDKREAQDGDLDRSAALAALNEPLGREGFEAFYGEDNHLYIRHIATRAVSVQANPHRPFTPAETQKRAQLSAYLDTCSEDELIEEVLLPLLRQLGYHRITSAGHKDKNLEHGKDVWMRFALPSQHMLYFGIQAKKGKLDASADSRNREGANTNIAVIHNQVLMMLDSVLFDPEFSREVLVDHAYIVAGGEITKSARLWLGRNLDATKRSRIMFMDRDDILNLFVVSNTQLPAAAIKVKSNAQSLDDDLPF